MEAAKPPKRWSYTVLPAGLLERTREAFYLLDMVRRGPAEPVRRTVRAYRDTLSRVEDAFGLRVAGKRILEIGPGQQLRFTRCFSIDNDVVGIDMDVIPQRLGLGDVLELMRSNPLLRTVKTLVRKSLGYDARLERALARELGVPGFKTLEVRRMDAAAMDFADDSFDFVCSYSVFEHVEHPEAALRETMRVLAPEGVAYILTHLYTSHSGHHDPRIVVGDPPPPYWPHLRPALAHTVHPAAYVNRLRLREWEGLFARVMPGVRFVHERQAELEEPLAELRAAGELPEYEDEELLTMGLVAMWRKPAR